MTLEEAKKILEKEGFELEKRSDKSYAVGEYFTEYESPEICEAMQVVSSAGYTIKMLVEVFNERKARFKKEYEENTKASGPGEEQTKEKKGIIYPTTFPKADFYHKYFLNEGYSALKQSASQFNDALLDEQAKKIAELTKEKTNLEDQITILNACKKHNENFGRKQIKRLGKEISKLNSIIHDKNAVLSDVAEELRLTKIREKNLAELGLKYVGENEKLKKELADKVVGKIDAQALKSAESALAYKEKKIAEKDEVIAKLREKLKSINMNRHNERICKKQLAEKDEVIADLGKELAATKTELEEKTKLVEIVRKGSKEYCEYGIAAEKMIQKMAKDIVNDRPVSPKDYEQYRLWANGYRFNPQLPDFSKEEEKKLEHAKKIRVSSDNAEEGADLSGIFVLCCKDFIDALKNVKDVWQE